MSMPSRRSPDPFAAQLGERIRQLRSERQMTLPELAEASGISRGHLSDLEHGKAVMNIGTLASLAGALKVPPFVICLVPKDDPQVAVIDHALAEVGGDVEKAAENIRAALFELDEQNNLLPNEDGP
jgi:transcriptional regulator with XRE-family HTH domain